jgi:redox-sensitive bicupin YhaK (pirin superfamily)
VTGLEQRIVLAPGDGSLGPLLRIADDRLAAGAGYGRHPHRAVDVVAVVLSGSLHHRWNEGAEMAAGDVAVLRAGAGLEHDEIAGDDGARILQCYLRAADAGAPASHRVHRGATGWIDLDRRDARLWVGRVAPGGSVDVPAGLLLLRGADGVLVEQQPGRTVREPGVALVWQLETDRPDWAVFPDPPFPRRS